MMNRFLGVATTIACLGFAIPAGAVPIPKDKTSEIVVDRAGFIPARKHMPVSGKIIAILVSDPQPVLSTEGRFGPADQLCAGWNGGSYRWVYVPVTEKPMIKNLSVPLSDGKTKVYPSLSMASPSIVKAWGFDAPYALVEIEVNDGEGSPANDSFVATKMTKLDGTKDYPIQTATVIADLRRQYEKHLSEKQKDLDAAMDEAAKKFLKDRKPTGPRETSTLMFASWMPKEEKLLVRFLTRITDGDYKYGGGIKIELRPLPLPPALPQGGAAPARALPNGLRYGTQFGIEYGSQFEVHKSGKIDKVKTLEVTNFSKEIPAPPQFVRPRPIPLPVPLPVVPKKGN